MRWRMRQRPAAPVRHASRTEPSRGQGAEDYLASVTERIHAHSNELMYETTPQERRRRAARRRRSLRSRRMRDARFRHSRTRGLLR